jgi:hypothetical protein
LCVIILCHNVGGGCDKIERIIKVGYEIRFVMEMQIKLGENEMLA